MSDKKKELFAEFLKTNTILIVDKSSASRRRLTKTLVDLGANRQNIESVAHYEEALANIESKKPKLVLSDFMINGGSGFDLYREYRKLHPDEKKATLILITSNISQSAVAKAAEEDVDSFIIKPYTVKSLEKSLITAVHNKLYPSKYVQKIDEGKELLLAGDYEQAEAIFEEAIGLSKKPALALFYQGQAKYFRDKIDEASDDYKKGLTFNNIHYKCQIGLYELLMQKKDFTEAYSVVRNIAKYFPSNPDRLKEVVHLAVRTQNYEDLEEYYDIFVELEERSEDVVNYMCSGLYVLGKHYMLQDNGTKGKEVFDKLAVSCMGIGKFLRGVVTVFHEYGHFDEAQRLLSRFASDAKKGEDYQVSAYLANIKGMSLAEKVSKGLELYNSGFKDKDVMRTFIAAMKEEGHDGKAKQYEEELLKLTKSSSQANKEVKEETEKMAA